MANQPLDQKLAFDTELSLTLPQSGTTLIGTLVNEPVMLMFKNQTTVSVFVSDTPGISVTITDVSQDTQAEVTADNSFIPGQTVYITGVVGMTELNGNTYTIISATSTTFTINVDSTGFTPYDSDGLAQYITGTTMVSGEEIIFDCRANHGTARNMGFQMGTSFFATATGGTGNIKISSLYAK